MISEILDNIQQRIAGVFSGVSEFLYISEWYTIVGVVILICFAIGFFFSHPWIRAALGYIVSVLIAFLVGMTLMFSRSRKDRQADREQIDALRHRQKEKNGGGGWFS